MSGPDSVSSEAFGANFPTSTGAPGSGHDVKNALDPTGDPTTDLVTPKPHSFVENTYHEVDQASWPHDGVEKASANAKPIVGKTTTDTGAGHGKPGHKNGRS